MCIRAIDYCPPVDITFGDFLRGVVTADLDYAPADTSGFRTVFIESFREWGIYPRGIRSMGVDALAWPSGAAVFADLASREEFVHPVQDLTPQMKAFVRSVVEEWTLESNRYEIWKALERVRAALWKWLNRQNTFGADYARLFGLVIDQAPPSVYRGKDGDPAVEIHAVRPAARRNLDARGRTDIVIEITQRRRGYFDPDKQAEVDDRSRKRASMPRPDFIFRAGCTVLVDAQTAEVRRVIRTAGTIADDDALARMRDYITGERGVVGNSFDAGIAESLDDDARSTRVEPFALLHQLEE
jgi:hypothetical protein